MWRGPLIRYPLRLSRVRIHDIAPSQAGSASSSFSAKDIVLIGLRDYITFTQTEVIPLDLGRLKHVNDTYATLFAANCNALQLPIRFSEPLPSTYTALHQVLLI